MTDFNQLVDARIADMARRRFGEDLQIGTVAPELGLYWIIGADRPEDAVLLGEAPWHTSRSIAALAANFSSLGVNSGNATIVSVVQKIFVINATAGVQTYKLGGVQSPQADTSSKVASRDLRRLSVSSQAFSRQQAADQLPSVAAFPVPANSVLQIDLIESEWMTIGGVLSLVLQSGVVNQEVTAYFWGRERSLRPEEMKLD